MGHTVEPRAARRQPVAQCHDRGRVDAGRRQQHLTQRLERGGVLAVERRNGIRFAERAAHERLVRLVQPEVVLRHERAHEREAVRMQPVRRQAQDHIARPRGRPVQQRRALHDPHAEPGEVEVVLAHQPRVLGRLAAHQRTAGEPAPVGDAADELRDLDRVQPAHRHVVEEEQGRSAGAHDVVRAHRDEVVADGVEPPDGVRDGGLRAHAVGRGDQHRLAIAGGTANAAPNPPRPPSTPGTCVAADRRAHQLDRAVPGLDVDAGVGVRRAAHRVPAISSMNLRSPASYGTGSG